MNKPVPPTYTKGSVMYARAVCMLAERPHTVTELAARLGVFRSTAANFVRVMHQRRLAHIALWRPPGQLRGDRPAAYAFGPGVDAPVEGRCCKRPRVLRRPFVGMIAFAELVQALLDGPCTPHDMVRASGLGISTMYRIINVLRNEESRVIFVAEWDRVQTRRLPLPAYQFGNCPDAKRPPRMSMKQVNKRYRERRKEASAYQALAAVMAANANNFNLAHSA